MKINHDYHNNKNVSMGVNKDMFIVLHHTGVVGEGNINILSGNTASKVSVHYLVMQDGRVYQFVDDNKIAWHAGTSFYDGYTGLNTYSIGIEIESDGYNYTDIQKSKVRELIGYIVQNNQIHYTNIIRHKDITKRKWDVGDDFWNKDYSSFDDYKFSFSIKKDMTQEEKEMLIISLMNLNSTLYGNVEDEEIKKLMAKVNKRYRELGFDNK